MLAGDGHRELLCSFLTGGSELDFQRYDLLVVFASFWSCNLLPANRTSSQGFAIILLLLFASYKSFH